MKDFFIQYWDTLIIFLGSIIGFVVTNIKFKKQLEENRNQFSENINTKIGDRISTTTTTFRRDWLQEFRKDISEYFSLFAYLKLLDDYEENILIKISNKEYDLLLRLNINNSIDKKIEEKLRKNSVLYKQFLKLLRYKNWDECDNIIDENNYSELVNKRAIAHDKMQAKVISDLDVRDSVSLSGKEKSVDAGKEYKSAVQILVRDLKFKMLEDITNQNYELLNLLRVYLKTEWERIKKEVRGDSIDFNYDKFYNDLLAKVSKNKEYLD